MTTQDIEAMAKRSEAMLNEMLDVLEGHDGYQTFDGSRRTEASAAAAQLALEHGSALRLLLCANHPAPGTALLRTQFEALLRSAWLMYAASDGEVMTLQAALDEEAERKANSLPMFSVMLKSLVDKAPPPLYAELEKIKTVLGKALNSYVHSGTHALNRHQHGFPLALARQVMVSSNAIGTMAAMMLANLTGDTRLGADINRLIPLFSDCLPELQPSPALKPRACVKPSAESER